MSNEMLVREIKQGINAKDNLDKLYKNNKGFIFKMVNKYKGYGELDDLEQEAFIGMYNAIEPYDETKGYKFLTYASHHIKQAITRYIDNNSNTIRLPVHMVQLIQRYKKVRNYFKVNLQREPTEKEYCIHLNLDTEQLEDVKKSLHRYNRLKSLDGQITGSDGDTMTLGQVVPDNVDVENQVINKSMDDKVKVELWEIVKRECDTESNQAIIHRYKDNLTLNESGEAMGITKEAVRQWQNKGLRKLRTPRVRKELQEKFEINIASVYRGSGIGSFNHDFTSSTERVALRNLELEKSL